MRKKVKIVIDTNLFVSALINRRNYIFFDLVVDGEIEIQTADEQLSELEDVLCRPKFNKYFSKKVVSELFEFLEQETKNHVLDKIPKVFKPDPKDDYLLALCKTSKADYLVTGDKELLKLGQYGKTQIVTYAEFISQK